MMRYLLDTNACIALLNNSSQALAARVRRHPPRDIGLPAPVVFELYVQRCRRSRRRKALRKIGVLPRSRTE